MYFVISLCSCVILSLVLSFSLYWCCSSFMYCMWFVFISLVMYSCVGSLCMYFLRPGFIYFVVISSGRSVFLQLFIYVVASSFRLVLFISFFLQVVLLPLCMVYVFRVYFCIYLVSYFFIDLWFMYLFVSSVLSCVIYYVRSSFRYLCIFMYVLVSVFLSLVGPSVLDSFFCLVMFWMY